MEEDEEESEAVALAAAEGRRRAEAAAVAQPKAAAEAMRVGGVDGCDCGRSVFVSDRPRSAIWINLIRFAASPSVMDWILPDYPLGPCNSSLSPSPSRCHLSIYTKGLCQFTFITPGGVGKCTFSEFVF